MSRRMTFRTGVLVLAVSVLAALPTRAAQAPQIWTPGPDMAKGRFGHTATLLGNGNVLVTGGVNQRIDVFPAPPSVILASAELYDAGQNKWRPAGNMSAPREGHTATLLPSGEVLVVGGRRDDENGVLGSAQIYNPATNAWSSTGGLLTARAFHTETLLRDGRVLIVGGKDGTGFPTASAEIYNPATGLWTAAGSLGTARFEHTASLLLDGKILVNGGRGPDYLDFLLGPWFQPVSSVEIYDPATNAWSPRAPMTDPRFFHTATVLGSGQVLVAGGSCAFVGFCFGALNSAEVFNPTTNAWTPTSPMVNFVQGHAATLLRYGQVLVTGRSEAFGANSVYDPATNQWTGIGRPRLDALPPLRLEHTATLLRNGRIFVVGGRERDFNGVSSTILLSLPTTELPPVVPSSQQEEFAQAFFQHTDEAGCLLTFVQVHGGTARYVDAPPTGTPNTPTPTLGLLIFQFDECSFFVRFADTVSFTTQFRTDPLLKTATLKGSASMFDLASAEAFSVTLDLTWTGYGDLIRDAGGHGSPGFGASYGQSTVRFANATGTISDGVTNFTPNPSSDDPITPDANSIKRVRTGGVFFNF